MINKLVSGRIDMKNKKWQKSSWITLSLTPKSKILQLSKYLKTEMSHQGYYAAMKEWSSGIIYL